jgi:hypothetical protein
MLAVKQQERALDQRLEHSLQRFYADSDAPGSENAVEEPQPGVSLFFPLNCYPPPFVVSLVHQWCKDTPSSLQVEHVQILSQ